MLIRYSAENYLSLKERQEFSFVAGAYKEHPEFVTQMIAVDAGLLRVAAIYGSNASGKSNVVSGLMWISRAVESSFKNWDPAKRIPVPRFKLGREAQRPSTFEVEFLLEGVRYEYGFTADENTFTDEWLFAYPNRNKNLLFQRKNGAFRFGKSLVGNKNTIKAVTRPNSLFLSAAAQNNHSQLLPIYQWLTSKLVYKTGTTASTSVAAKMCLDPAAKSQILKFLRSADLGIVDLNVAKFEKPADYPEKHKELVAALESFIGMPVPPLPEPHRIRLAHAAGEQPVDLDMSEESQGTQAYFVLLGQVLSALQSGSTLIVDELDSSLHPLLALEIVALFNNPATNPKSAQLLFNTHDTNLLNSKYLRRDQIWFTEKDEFGQTHLYPLSDFKSRNDENLEKGYLQGRFGAVPFITNSGLKLLNQDEKETA